MEQDTTLETKLTYALSDEGSKHSAGFWKSTREFFSYIHGDGGKLLIGFSLVLLDAVANILTPYLIAQAIDRYIKVGDAHGLVYILLILSGIYIVTMVTGYIEGVLNGVVSQKVLFRLRQSIFNKLQELPIAFFNQNKAGDLMSRINGDTDKLNQFLSDSLPRFMGSFFSIFGIAVFVFFINVQLSLVMLSAAVVLFLITRILSPMFGKVNKRSLNSVGGFTASIQENLTNFRVIVAYSKREYLSEHLSKNNKSTFTTGVRAEISNRVFEPIYDSAGGFALIAVLAYGLYLYGHGVLTIGILIAFVTYTQRFYNPLQFMATIIGEIQVSLAAWSRIRAVLHMKNDLAISHSKYAKSEALVSNDGSRSTSETGKVRLELRDVTFGYEGGGTVIEDANLTFLSGKTYALVGPTGGGKSTLVSLMARLYDPLKGGIFLDGRDIRSYLPEERAEIISVILQDPLLFGGTVGDNIRYGNKKLSAVTDGELNEMLSEKGFGEVLGRFEHGLGTNISSNGGGLSLGQKQLISFMRAILREPELLVLDEATANIDTVTEALLTKALNALPANTTKVIIAHRLNTIKEADEIMFVNGRHVTKAGSFEDAIRLIESSKRNS